MKTRELAVLGLLMVSSQLLHANGGGYFRGGVESTGDVAGFQPKATENIRILDEKLTIKLGPTEADVEVRYLMRNVTDKKVKVRFGFPVEESFDDETMGYGRDTKPKAGDGKKLAYCRNYQITAADIQEKATWQGESRETKDPQFKGVVGWMISEITFAANEEKPVKIAFQSSYPLGEWHISRNTSRSASSFKYRLSTAACWAGTIGTGKIVLEPKGIDPDWLKVIKPVNRFKKEGTNWIWNFKDLEPTLADDLTIESRPGESGYPANAEEMKGTHAEYFERNDQWTIAHASYHVKASSTLPRDKEHSYEADHIKEWWESWAEGAKGPGVGEWLELTPVAPKPLTAISITPGFRGSGSDDDKAKELFAANARPKKVRVELNDEKTLTFEVPDVRDEVEFPVTTYKKPVKKIRLTFEEVWPGNRFEDLCVANVRLHVRLDKKPKLDPCR